MRECRKRCNDCDVVWVAVIVEYHANVYTYIYSLIHRLHNINILRTYESAFGFSIIIGSGQKQIMENRVVTHTRHSNGHKQGNEGYNQDIRCINLWVNSSTVVV